MKYKLLLIAGSVLTWLYSTKQVKKCNIRKTSILKRKMLYINTTRPLCLHMNDKDYKLSQLSENDYKVIITECDNYDDYDIINIDDECISSSKLT